jgi:hypothetical protein
VTDARGVSVALSASDVPVREPLAHGLVEHGAPASSTGTAGSASGQRGCGGAHERGIEGAAIHREAAPNAIEI